MMKFHMGMNLLVMGLAVWSIGLSTQASADDDENRIGLRPSLHVCLVHSEGYTSSMLDCGGDEQEYQDKRLDGVYHKLLGRLPEDQRQSLKDNEQSWIRTRENKCAQPKDSGTMGDINYSSCFLTETARHATRLEDMLRRSKP